MDLNDFVNGKIWGIQDAYLQVMFNQLPGVLEASKTHAAALFERSRREGNEPILKEGVAVIPITGPITSRASFFSFLYAGTSLDQLTKIFTDVIQDPEVKAVVLNFDSPGGTISGVGEFSKMIYDQRTNKPVVSFTSSIMASSAYWIGSAANRIMAGKTASVGSIGVVAVHYDYSKSDEKNGVKRTIIKSGKYKDIGNNAAPLSQLAFDTFEADLRYIHGLFIEGALLKNRGMKLNSLGDIAEAKIYIGQQAVDVGLVDAVGTLDMAVDLARSLVKPPQGDAVQAIKPGVTISVSTPPPIFGKSKTLIFTQAAANRTILPIKQVASDDFMFLVDQYQIYKKCKRSTALSAIAKAHPESHKNYLAGLRSK